MSFQKNPNITLLGKDENIQLILRRHWIVFIFLLFYLLIFIIIGCIYILSLPIFDFIIPRSLSWIILILWWNTAILMLYIKWINDELDLLIITNRRVIGIDQIGFLNRELSQCGLDQVQEVNTQTQGIFGNLLHYGKVTIHTASDRSDIEMAIVPEAIENGKIIHNLVDKYREKYVRNKIRK